MTPKLRVDRAPLPRIRQGDILRDIQLLRNVQHIGDIIDFTGICFPLVYVLSQDCDLESDFRERAATLAGDIDRHDKHLLSILLAPVYNIEHVFAGDHLSWLGRKMAPINRVSTDGKNLYKDKNPRYHYLEFPTALGLAPSVVDFKHYFTADVEYINAEKPGKFVCSVSVVFREEVSQRFAAFLSRVGVPPLQTPEFS